MTQRFMTVAAVGACVVAGCSEISDTTSAVSAAVAQDVVDAECNLVGARDELTYEDAALVYDCIKDDLLAGYETGGKGYIDAAKVSDYRNWTPASTLPADPGFHGNRFLLTYVNEIGAAEYLKYEAERDAMPAGTLIAKESFSINDDGNTSAGPLFFMEKTAAGTSPNTNDWYYYAVAPSGAPMAVNVVSACHECHEGNFGDSDGLGYPVEEARVTN